MTFKQLRRKHPEFIYQDFNYQVKEGDLLISFHFLLKPDIEFKPKVKIRNIDQKRLQVISKPLLDNWIFHLGLAEIPSYWKLACSPLITIKTGSLNQFQQNWWRDLLIQGLGEFFFQNQIDFTQENLITIKAAKNQSKISKKSNLTYPYPYLVPVGGGKDSSLLLGLLDKNQLEYGCLHLQPQSPAALQIAKSSACRQKIVVEREIHPQLLQLNNQGYLNGHTPFSSYLSFLSVLVSHLFGYQQILTANEHSASQGNIEYLDQTINHQYSKSLEYEEKFRNYSQEYLQAGLKLKPDKSTDAAGSRAEYLSALRPLNELQIAALFSQFKKYHQLFKSCNVNQQQGTWCHHCPKCLFVFALLYPFINKHGLTTQIFHSNLFENPNLVETALKLTDQERAKPFECVGTYQESIAAFYLSIKKYEKEQTSLPPVLQAVKQKVLVKYKDSGLETQAQDLLTSWHKKHHLDQQLTAILQKEL